MDLIDDYQSLFMQDIPLLDVRAPIEFAAGAFPQAHNIPLLDDRQRHLIGIEYKRAGQAAAIKLGERLLGGEEQKKRQQAWQAFFEQHPQGVIYCFRGGLRSKIAQQWIYEQTGMIYPRVKGGYKQLRQYLIQILDDFAQKGRFIILGGRTGVGKTLALKKMERSIDLEGLAHHRGSAFGRQPQPQPSQVDFENALAVQLLKQGLSLPILLEDEGKNIGSVHIPPPLFQNMQRSPLIILKASLEQRIENILQDYVIDALALYQEIYGLKKGFESWSTAQLKALYRIRKRLGGLRYRQMEQRLEKIIQQGTESLDEYRHWVEELLVQYYDPMYDYQIEKKKHRIIFSGDLDEVLQFLTMNLIYSY